MDPKERKRPYDSGDFALNPGHPQFCGVPEILFRSSSTPQGGTTVSDALHDGGCQRTSLVKKKPGISQSDYRKMNWFQWLWTLFTVQGRLYHQILQKIEYVKTICLQYALLQLRLEGTKA